MEIGEEKDEKRAHAHEYTLHSTLPSPAIIGLLRRRPAASYAYTHIFMQDAGKHSTASLYKTYKQDYTAPREERSNSFLLTFFLIFPSLFLLETIISSFSILNSSNMANTWLNILFQDARRVMYALSKSRAAQGRVVVGNDAMLVCCTFFVMPFKSG